MHPTFALLLICILVFISVHLSCGATASDNSDEATEILPPRAHPSIVPEEAGPHAVPDPDASTASRRSEMAWESVKRKRYPQPPRVAKLDASSMQDLFTGVAVPSATAWFELPRYRAETRFGVTVEQRDAGDPAVAFLKEENSAVESSRGGSGKNKKQNTNDEGAAMKKRLVFTGREIVSLAAAFVPITAAARDLEFNVNACASALSCVEAAACGDDNFDYSNRSSTINSLVEEALADTTPLAESDHHLRHMQRLTPRQQERRFLRSQLQQLVGATAIPAVQAVSDFLSAAFAKCDSEPLRLISTEILRASRNLLLESGDAALVPALVLDLVGAPGAVGANRVHLPVGTVRSARVTFTTRGKRFVVDVERYLHPEVKGPVPAAGAYRPELVVSLLPRSVEILPAAAAAAANVHNNNNNNNKSSNVFSVLSWNLWHTQNLWLSERSVDVARWIKLLSPNAVLLQEMRIDNSAEQPDFSSPRQAAHDNRHLVNFLARGATAHFDVEARRRAAACDTGGKTDVHSHTTYVRSSLSMMEHLHRRVRTKIPYFVDLHGCMLYPRERVLGSQRFHPAAVERLWQRGRQFVAPPGMFQFQLEGLGVMHKHVVLATRKLLLPREIDVDGNFLNHDQHQRGLLCHALLVTMRSSASSSTASCSPSDNQQQNACSSSLPPEPPRGEPRTVRIDVCTSHFSLNPRGRINNARHAAEAMEAFAREELLSSSSSSKLVATATIFTGDFNAEPDDASYKFLVKSQDSGGAGFTDVFVELFGSDNNKQQQQQQQQQHRRCSRSEWKGACLGKQPPLHCACYEGANGETFDRRFQRGGSKRIDFTMYRNWLASTSTSSSSSSSSHRLEAKTFRHIDGNFALQPPVSDHVGLMTEFVLITQ